MFSSLFPKIIAKKHFPPFLLHLERCSLKLVVMIGALLFEHSHESEHLVQAVMGGEWVMILTEPACKRPLVLPQATNLRS